MDTKYPKQRDVPPRQMQENRPQDIQTQIAGRIAKWYVKEGDIVRKGDTDPVFIRGQGRLSRPTARRADERTSHRQAK